MSAAIGTGYSEAQFGPRNYRALAARALVIAVCGLASVEASNAMGSLRPTGSIESVRVGDVMVTPLVTRGYRQVESIVAINPAKLPELRDAYAHKTIALSINEGALTLFPRPVVAKLENFPLLAGFRIAPNTRVSTYSSSSIDFQFEVPEALLVGQPPIVICGSRVMPSVIGPSAGHACTAYQYLTPGAHLKLTFFDDQFPQQDWPALFAEISQTVKNRVRVVER